MLDVHHGTLITPYANPELTEIALPRLDITQEDYDARFEELIDTWRVIQDPITGICFEICVVNSDSPDGCIVDLSTYNSSISTNAGNAEEVAQCGAANSKERVYVSTPGNGHSDFLSAKEQKWHRETGRLTWLESGRPEAIPNIQAMARALLAAGFEPSSISGISAGAAFGIALAQALPEGSVESMYLKSLTNLSDFHPTKLMYLMLYGENQKSKKYYNENRRNEWSVTTERIDAAKVRLKKIEGLKAKPNYPKTVRKLVSELIGYSIGPEQGNPALADTLTAYKQQPNMKVTLHVPEMDAMYTTLDDVVAFIERTASFGKDIVGLITEGTHVNHTFEPQGRWAAERYSQIR